MDSDQPERRAPTPRELKAARSLHRGFRARRWMWRSHLNSYLGVNAGLAIINLFAGGGVWFVYPLVGWGMGLAVHALNHRSWKRENAAQLVRAEEILGLTPVAPAPLSSSASTAAPVPASPENRLEDDPAQAEWESLLGRCRGAVGAAERSLEQLRGGGGLEARAQLKAGLERVEELAKGARRIRNVLSDMAPEGADALEVELRMLDGRIAEATDERLKKVYAQNRQLLSDRRDKIRRLEAEEQRMQATGQGFLLAADNIRLDAARLAAGHSPRIGPALTAPLERLDEEVELMRQVEAELETS